MKKNQKGFTLIELIIVIGIMAILGGVAVPTYGAYMERANKAADETLLSDISYALQVGARADTSFPGDDIYVVGLNTDAAPVYTVISETSSDTSPVKSVLQDAFGTDLDSALRLKYDGWTCSLSDLTYFVESSYSGNEEELLEDIQLFTNALAYWFEQQISAGKDITSLLGSEFTEYLEERGIGTTDTQSMANAMTLYLAQAVKNADLDEHITWWKSGLSESSIPSEYNGMQTNLSDLAVYMGEEVACCEAVYQYICSNGGGTCNSADGNAIATLWDSVQKASNYSELSQAIGNMMQHCGMYEDVGGNSADKKCSACTTIFNVWKESQASADCEAYINCLIAISESEDDFLGNISNSTGNLYTDGTAMNLVQSYTNLAANSGTTDVAVMVSEDSDGDILVKVFNQDTGGSDVTTSATESIAGTVDASGVSIGSSNNYTMNVGDTMKVRMSFDLSAIKSLITTVYPAANVTTNGAVQDAFSQICTLVSEDPDSVAVSVSGITVSGSSVVVTASVKAEQATASSVKVNFTSKNSYYTSYFTGSFLVDVD